MHRDNRRKAMQSWSLLLAALALVSCASMSTESESYLTPAQLNASKSTYHENRVTVRGWMRSEFENYSLWQSREANERGNFAKDCVSLLVPESMETKQYNKQYVEVKGVFLERLASNVVPLGGCNVTTLQLIEGIPPTVTEKPRH